MHHAYAGLDLDALVYIGTDDGRDVVWRVDADGTTTELFDGSAFWAEHGATRPCDGNGLHWDPTSDTVLFSSDNDNTVVQLDRQTGEALAWFGELDGAWAFADGAPAWYKQHSPTFPSPGRLMVSSHVAASNYEMVAREYSMDEGAQELSLVWTCGEGSGIEASHGGAATRLPGGNTMLQFGPSGRVRELTPTCEVAWDLAWEGGAVSSADLIGDLYAFLP